MTKSFKYRGEPVSLTAFAVSTFVSLGGFIFGKLSTPPFRSSFLLGFYTGTPLILFNSHLQSFRCISHRLRYR